MVELLADEPLASARTLRRAYGGDVLNALVAASRLGSRTGFVTRVGSDPFGEGLLDAWRREGVDVTHAPLVSGENGVYFISLSSSGEREFTYRRVGSAAAALAPGHLDPVYIGGAKVLLLSGITQAISPTARAATFHAARLARSRGTLVAYDPNYRPHLWATLGGVEAARAAFLEVLPLVGALLPSFPADAELVCVPMSDNPDAFAGLAPLVAVKASVEGSWLLQEGKVTHLPATPTPHVVDTTGAGDAWNGAFLHGVAIGQPPETAARKANRVAAATLAHRGAIPSKEATM